MQNKPISKQQLNPDLIAVIESQNKPVPKSAGSSDLPPRMIAAIAALAEASKELNECIAILWAQRVTNLKNEGFYDVRPAMETIRIDITKACQANFYSAVQVAVISAAIAAFAPQKKSTEVRSMPFNGRGGAA